MIEVGDIVNYHLGPSFGLLSMHTRPAIVLELHPYTPDHPQGLTLHVFLGGLELKQIPQCCYGASDKDMIAHAWRGSVELCWTPKGRNTR